MASEVVNISTGANQYIIHTHVRHHNACEVLPPFLIKYSIINSNTSRSCVVTLNCLLNHISGQNTSISFRLGKNHDTETEYVSLYNYTGKNESVYSTGMQSGNARVHFTWRVQWCPLDRIPV